MQVPSPKVGHLVLLVGSGSVNSSRYTGGASAGPSKAQVESHRWNAFRIVHEVYVQD